MSTIEWGDPPDPQTGPKGKWAQTLQPFRERPGQWGKLGRFNDGTQSNIKNGVYKDVEKGEFEAVGRNKEIKNGKPTYEVWVRYVGKKET